MSALGARFDMEVDAFLVLVLSVYVATLVGPWALVIGAMRYAFVAASWALPWMRASLPTRYCAKVVAATQGIVLLVASSQLLPAPGTAALVGAALGAAGLVVRLQRCVAVAARPRVRRAIGRRRRACAGRRTSEPQRCGGAPEAR